MGYRDQKDIARTNQTGAACDAYFYIDDKGPFMPLGIRTNVGANLVYTPLDDPNDWLLAKLMFNVNDFYGTQFQHLAATQEVAQIAFMAAFRTLSIEHPVFGVINRLAYQVFAIQPLAESVLFTKGAAVDQLTPFTGSAGRDYSTGMHKNGWGRFLANYLDSEVRSRGLINSDFGPRLKSFPFYEDASVIIAAMRKFVISFVYSYYPSTDIVVKDE